MQHAGKVGYRSKAEELQKMGREMERESTMDDIY
jgi:hypothetical protein